MRPLEKILHKRIVDVVEEKVTGGKQIKIILEEGLVLQFGLEGGAGEDGDWHNWAVLRLNGVEKFRG